MWMVLRRSAPYALLVLLMSFYNRLEPVLIERLLPGEKGLQQTGIYAKAFRLFDAGNNISMLFAVLLLPMFANMLKRKEAIDGLARLSFSLIFTLSAVVAVGGIMYAESLMKLLYGLRPEETQMVFESRITQSALIFSTLMMAYVAVSTTYVFGTLLTANGNLRLLNLIAGSGVALSLLLNFILIPRFEATGAAISSLSVQALMAIAQYLAARRIIGLRFGQSFFLRLLIFILLLLVAAFTIRELNTGWIFKLIITFAAGIISIPITGLVSFNEIVTRLFSSVNLLKKS
jgi:O-antigen/teichoic acid export membrane protein